MPGLLSGFDEKRKNAGYKLTLYFVNVKFALEYIGAKRRFLNAAAAMKAVKYDYTVDQQGQTRLTARLSVFLI